MTQINNTQWISSFIGKGRILKCKAFIVVMCHMGTVACLIIFATMKAIGVLVSLCWHQKRACPFLVRPEFSEIGSGPMLVYVNIFSPNRWLLFSSGSYFWQNTRTLGFFSPTGSLAYLEIYIFFQNCIFYQFKPMRKIFIVYLKLKFHYNGSLQV